MIAAGHTGVNASSRLHRGEGRHHNSIQLICVWQKSVTASSLRQIGILNHTLVASLAVWIAPEIIGEGNHD